jgi:hypothetical protein
VYKDKELLFCPGRRPSTIHSLDSQVQSQFWDEMFSNKHAPPLGGNDGRAINVHFEGHYEKEEMRLPNAARRADSHEWIERNGRIGALAVGDDRHTRGKGNAAMTCGVILVDVTR